MYLSKLGIKNFRSIKSLLLDFKKGKNVILGRNNSGKSNILKAIDLILGESSPTWEGSDKIGENDFHNAETTKPFLIWCELTREPNENLDFEEINKCFGIRYYATTTGWQNNKPQKAPVRVGIPTNNEIELFKKLDEIFKTISQDENNTNSEYVNSKLKNQNTFEKQFENKYQFAFAFYANKDEVGKLNKELRFFYRENDSVDWMMSFTAPIRHQFLQSALIPSFRDPQNQLRINSWGWYGKLLRNSIDPNNAALLKAFENVKSASNDVFSSLKEKINNSKIKVAFPNTEISFQFNPDNKQDIHKSALIYVNDGFTSQLQEKGAGIQSAIIIGLFDFYTREIAHSGCSLLAIEEPELYLHPHGRRVISDRLEEFLGDGKNQVILTTHSAEFVSSIKEELNVIVVKKDIATGSSAKNTSFLTPKEKRILLKTQNTEMFFADKVILVEGGDKFILEVIAREYGRAKEPSLGPNWLNDLNISIISVGGKTEFSKYVTKLNELNIEVFVMADFDFIQKSLSEFITDTKLEKSLTDNLNAIKGKFSAGIKYKHLKDIPDNLKTVTINFMELLKQKRVFILRGELEDYLTPLGKASSSNVEGKEEKAICVASEIFFGNRTVQDCLIPEEFYSLLESVTGSGNKPKSNKTKIGNLGETLPLF